MAMAMAMRSAALVVLSCSVAARAAVVQSSLRQQGISVADGNLGLVRPLEFDHRLRVCNAFPLDTGMDVLCRNEKLTGASPLPYKDCRDFHSQLKAGDKLEFRMGDATAGTFSVSELPANDAVLLLVVHRHDTISTAVSFESHVFAQLKDAQVAIIDTYKGSKHSVPRIRDRQANSTKARSEELRFNSVVAVSPGDYEVEFNSSSPRAELVALHHESYVILRTGVEAKQGPSFPEEIVVFPQSDVQSLHSGVMGLVPGVVLPVLGALAAWA